MLKPVLLGVNIDHVATLREVRGTPYPDPLKAMAAAERGGADGITLHLREDRRHIQDRDVVLIQQQTKTRLNLEMALAEPILLIAEKIRPLNCCLVPEKREELTTEGGLDVISEEKAITAACRRLAACGIAVSLFIDPDSEQIKAAKRTGAPVIEIHTGAYADAKTASECIFELARITDAAKEAADLGLIVNAGHGLHYANVQAIARLPEINELNIGHFLVAEAVFVGLEQAVFKMKQLIQEARS